MSPRSIKEKKCDLEQSDLPRINHVRSDMVAVCCEIIDFLDKGRSMDVTLPRY